jgi:hypothetical protein
VIVSKERRRENKINEKENYITPEPAFTGTSAAGVK